ncbi:MAG: FkbM family methyltransferase [Planctomycetota bacterium]|nr:FkbM family methyltransferase [Planctomycetota bacterium]
MSISLRLGGKVRFLYRAWRYRWRVEPAEISFVLHHVSAGQTCLDIGAHRGAFTYWMQRKVGPTGRVIAFEPQPELARYLDDVKQSFGLENVEVVHAALSSSTGECRLYRPSSAPTPSATVESGAGLDCSVTVPMVSLDEYLRDTSVRPIAFIKCDVEGHELDVFRGAESMLIEDRPTLLFECEQRHRGARPIDDVFDYLTSLGFVGHFIEGRQLRALTSLPAEHRVHGHRDYVYNFVFLPRRENDDARLSGKAA